jgi:hypothetical protein
VKKPRALVSSLALASAVCASAHAGQTNNILLTGYWPPTNEMLRQFSPNPSQNGGTYNGANWEGRGFNIVSYFPEFTTGPGGFPWGTGDFEVDYQDTSADWTRITNDVKPVAIITFSRGASGREWQMEPAYQRFRNPGEVNPPGRTIPQYSSDQRDVLYPTNVQMTAEPVGRIRDSSLPMQQIVNNVEAVYPNNADLNPHIANYNPANPDAFDFGGSYLSGFIGYHGAWYYDEHSAPATPFRTFAAGHIHVGTTVPVAIGEDATEITLRTLIDYIKPLLPTAGDANIDGNVNLDDFNILATNFGLQAGAVWEDADFTYDGRVNLDDFNLLAGNFGFAAAAGAGAPSPGDWSALAAAVPEPATIGSFALALPMLKRRPRATRRT